MPGRNMGGLSHLWKPEKCLTAFCVTPAGREGGPNAPFFGIFQVFNLIADAPVCPDSAPKKAHKADATSMISGV